MLIKSEAFMLRHQEKRFPELLKIPYSEADWKSLSQHGTSAELSTSWDTFSCSNNNVNYWRKLDDNSWQRSPIEEALVVRLCFVLSQMSWLAKFEIALIVCTKLEWEIYIVVHSLARMAFRYADWWLSLQLPGLLKNQLVVRNV